MIDFENCIFSTVSDPVRTKYTKAIITSEDIVEMPATFPAISIVEVDNYVNRNTSDSGSIENHVRVVYEVNVYSNLKSKKRSQCKEIISMIDDEFIKLGFERMSKQPISMGNTELYRMVARYQAVISKDGVIYRN